MYERPLTSPGIRNRPFSSTGTSTGFDDPSAGAIRMYAFTGLRFMTGSNTFPARTPLTSFWSPAPGRELLPLGMLATGGRRLSGSFQKGRLPLGTLPGGSGRAVTPLFEGARQPAAVNAAARRPSFKTTRTVLPSMDARKSDHRMHAGPASLRGPPDGAKPAIPVNWRTDATSPEPTLSALYSVEDGRSPPSGWGKNARLFDSVKTNWRGNRDLAAAETNEVLSVNLPGVLKQFSRTRAVCQVDIIDTGTPLVTGRIFR